jgi:carboxyl-terminal processing protease
VFAVGFRSIALKDIEAVTLPDVAVEGLKGLGAIDPALIVRRDGDEVVLLAQGRAVQRYPAPADGDPDAWGTLAARLAEDGGRVSADLGTVSAERVYEAVFDGTLSTLDIFSRYAGAVEARRNRAKREGFGGIGIRFKMERGAPRVTAVMPETPAAEAGLQVGDRLTRVGGETVEGLSAAALIRKLRGPEGSLVSVTAARRGVAEPLQVTMSRAHIVSATVTELSKDGIAVFKVGSFNQATGRSLGAKLEEAHRRMGPGLKGLILDLRGNPGGLLKQSVKVADLLLEKGRIVATQGRHAESDQEFTAGGGDVFRGLPVVVVLDGRSASAAEIVAAALQDQGRAVILGTTSFGKGTVQTVVRLPNDGEITLTWSRLMAPSGYSLHGLGVRPDLCTSGLIDADQAALGSAVERAGTGRAVVAAWRRVAIHDKPRRKSLRATCPAERRFGSVDLKLARRLILSPALYTRVLDIRGTSIAEAAEPPAD